MLGILYGIIIICVLVTGILWMKLRLYKGQIRHIKEELSMLHKEDTNYRLSSYCRIGETEEMIQLLNETLQEYKEEVRRLKNENRLYKESITSISHDIRTPLTSAKGYTQMLLNGLTMEKQQEYIEKIEQRIDDVTEMLNQLFEYARVEAGELEFIPEKINLNNVFAETISMFYQDFRIKNCEPVVEIVETPCYVFADKRAIIRVIENLIRNALVHGSGDYVFTLKKNGERVILSVSNRTDSIEEKDIAYIFDRFYTTDQSRTRKTTGLGLAIVKRFTSQMGGSVSAFLEGDRFVIEAAFEIYESK